MTEMWLMHGDARVAKVSTDPQGGFMAVDEIAEPSHMPPGTFGEGPGTLAKLNRWWSERAIPSSRWNPCRKLKESGVHTPESLMLRTMGIGLSDSYWIVPIHDAPYWSDVDFYRNGFSDYLGDLLFYGIESDSISFDSPDAALNGNLRKRWSIHDGRRFLIKCGGVIYRQEPFNEVIAGRLMERLGIPHVGYTLETHNEDPCSVCPCFSDVNREFVPSWGIMASCYRRKGESLFDHTLRAHVEFGIEDPRGFLERMIVVDYLMANEDRHFGNFGVMRNPVTLKTLGFAPIFDSGASLGFSQPAVWIDEGYNLSCMPFKITHGEQIKLVSSFDWLDFGALDGFGDEVRDMFGMEGSTIDPRRSDAIAGFLERRIFALKEFIEKGNYPSDDPRTDLVLKKGRCRAGNPPGWKFQMV